MSMFLFLFTVLDPLRQIKADRRIANETNNNNNNNKIRRRRRRINENDLVKKFHMYNTIRVVALTNISQKAKYFHDFVHQPK